MLLPPWPGTWKQSRTRGKSPAAVQSTVEVFLPVLGTRLEDNCISSAWALAWRGKHPLAVPRAPVPATAGWSQEGAYPGTSLTPSPHLLFLEKPRQWQLRSPGLHVVSSGSMKRMLQVSVISDLSLIPGGMPSPLNHLLRRVQVAATWRVAHTGYSPSRVRSPLHDSATHSRTQ